MTTSAHHTVMPRPLNLRAHNTATMAQRVSVQQSIGGYADALAFREHSEGEILTRAAVLLAECIRDDSPDAGTLAEIAGCFQLVLEQRVVKDAE